jgi:RAC serine/threonine-protein kinase
MESGVLPTVVKQGWLEKKGEYITSWRKRYFALYTDGSFNGYKEEPTQEMIQRSTQNSRYKYENTFTVKNSVVIRHDDREKGDVYFKVRCRQRDDNKVGFVERSFRAASTDERDSWARMIEGVFSELNGEGDQMDTDAEDPYDLISPPETVKKYTAKDFEMIKMIGKGTFGNVVLVYRKDDPTQTRMAMKQISKDHIREKEETEHTKSELQVLKQCNHPFLIKLHHAFNCKDTLYLVMEYARGGEIYTHLSRCNQFPISRCRFYGAEIVSAFAYLHSVG